MRVLSEVVGIQSEKEKKRRRHVEDHNTTISDNEMSGGIIELTALLQIDPVACCQALRLVKGPTKPCVPVQAQHSAVGACVPQHHSTSGSWHGWMGTSRGRDTHSSRCSVKARPCAQVTASQCWPCEGFLQHCLTHPGRVPGWVP